MGLDMNFFAVPNGKEPTEENVTAIQYFRKHATLHDLLLKEWLKVNPTKSVRDFNYIMMEVTPDFFGSLLKICKAPKQRTHYSEECFWGESSPEDWEETKNNFIPNAKYYIEQGYKIYYFPWW